MSTEPVTLTNCDREPIHIPGSIQPHGCLLACDATATTVLRHSLNASELLGVSVSNGAELRDVLGDQLTHDLRNAIGRSLPGKPGLLFAQIGPSGQTLDIAVHQHHGLTIIEMELAHKEVGAPLELARTMIGRLTAVEKIDRLTRDTARLVRAMLRYDRVMVYEFAADGSGKVVSEARRTDLESFLGQHFPAADIPQQARALYLKNTIRIISDANCDRVPIDPVLDSSGEPLDLSFAHLRSVSPIHCEYLRNMGVGASMSISIILDGVLWGMIACHHYAPRVLSMAERVAGELFGDFFSLQLSALRHRSDLAAAKRTRAILDGLVYDAAREADLASLLRDRLADFHKVLPADGIGIWLDGTWSSIGITPPDDAAPALVQWAKTTAEGQIWASSALSTVLPDAARYAASAAGVLIVPLSLRPRDYLFFFRREVEQTLNWAGDPNKTYAHGQHGDRLTPRTSFAIWKETVRNQSMPWAESDRQFAEAARGALVEVVMRHSELLADERAKAEVRQRMLNEELNHRVKNILAIIKSLVGRSYKDGETIETYAEALRGRIQALSLAHDQLSRGSDGGALRDLLEAELTPYRRDRASIRLQGPDVWLDARSFSIMALVLHELATNAAKYGALSSGGSVLSIDWSMDAGGACEMWWRESGGPRVVEPTRRGFGTTLIDRSIPFDLGGESEVRYHPDGLRARFRIPARFVSVHASASAPDVAATERAVDAGGFAGQRALIVEDQLLIAIDLEALLEEAGFEVLATVTSPREGLAFLRENRPDIAILDLNLGDVTSEAVADMLVEMGVPFVFATGYANDAIPQNHRGAAIVRKPYNAASLLPQLRRLVG